MKKSVSAIDLLPRNVVENSKPNEVSDLESIKELLQTRTIVAADRFLLDPGKYQFEGVTAAEWAIDKKRKAVMAVITFKGGKMTTIGSLRKIDANLKSYGPDHMPLNEAEVLDKIIAQGIEVTSVEETRATVFQDGDRVVDKDDISGTGYKTRPVKIMAWKFGPEKK